MRLSAIAVAAALVVEVPANDAASWVLGGRHSAARSPLHLRRNLPLQALFLALLVFAFLAAGSAADVRLLLLTNSVVRVVLQRLLADVAYSHAKTPVPMFAPLHAARPTNQIF